MESLEPKKLALIRIWQILKDYSDYRHPLTQGDIAGLFERDYGIVIERKAISRNLSLLKEAGIESKTDNQELFYNIELIDSAIERQVRVAYDYNKIGIDRKLHKSSYQTVSPYQMILHNQRYYLMAYSEYWGNMVFHGRRTNNRSDHRLVRK